MGVVLSMIHFLTGDVYKLDHIQKKSHSVGDLWGFIVTECIISRTLFKYKKINNNE
jgi:hypothetical protein